MPEISHRLAGVESEDELSFAACMQLYGACVRRCLAGLGSFAAPAARRARKTTAFGA